MQPHPNTSTSSKPFLKWPGGKQRLLAQLLPLLPERPRLIEPFVGAGAIFLGLAYDRYVLNDANTDLTNMWLALQADGADFIARAAEFFVEANRSNEAFLRIRHEFNSTTDRLARATRLPYLSHFGFNGLFRVNRKGVFNTPYSNPAKLPTFPESALAAASKKLERCLVLSGDFTVPIALAGPGDVVYCDPPYSPSTTGKSFTSYTADGFVQSDHERLVEAGLQAVSRGAHVVISNHDTPLTRELYRGWDITSLSVRRSVSAATTSRGNASELVAQLPVLFDISAPLHSFR